MTRQDEAGGHVAAPGKSGPGSDGAQDERPAVWRVTADSFDRTYRLARRIAIGAIGGTVLALGVALTVLPGPAFVVIPMGLGILSMEFAFARRWLRMLSERAGLRKQERPSEPGDSSPPTSG